MAELGEALNVEEQAADFKGEFTVLPPGWYQAVVIKSELKDNKNKNGKILELTFQVSGQTEIIDRLNMVNPSDVAQRIGRSTLCKIALEVGVTGEIRDSNVLHGRPVDIKVAIENFKSNTSGKELKSNKITDYRKAGSGSYGASDTGGAAAGSTGQEQKKSAW